MALSHSSVFIVNCKHISNLFQTYFKLAKCLLVPIKKANIFEDKIEHIMRYVLLPSIRAAEIVECVRKYMDGSSQNLQSLSSY